MTMMIDTAGRVLKLAALTMIEPGAAGQLTVKMTGAAELVDIRVGVAVKGEIQHDEGLQVLSIRFGRIKIERKEGQSWAQAIARSQVKRIPSNCWVTVIAQNNTDVPKPIEGRMQIINEEPNMLPRGVRSTAKTSNVTASEGAVARVNSKTVAHSKNHGGIVRRPRSHVERQGQHAAAAQCRQPDLGERCVLLLQGHALGILRYLEHRVPIHRSYGPTLIREFMTSLSREGSTGFNHQEVAVILEESVITRFLAHLQKRGPYPSPMDSTTIATAINSALAQANTSPAPIQATG